MALSLCSSVTKKRREFSKRTRHIQALSLKETKPSMDVTGMDREMIACHWSIKNSDCIVAARCIQLEAAWVP